jgi:hypothetical protein
MAEKKPKEAAKLTEVPKAKVQTSTAKTSKPPVAVKTSAPLKHSDSSPPPRPPKSPSKPSFKPSKPPSHEALVRDLATLRQKGITALRGMKLDALSAAALILEDGALERIYLPQAIESMLRSAVDRMDGGRHAISAELLFGLAQGTRGANPTDLRREAADRLNVATETFRKDHEKTAVAELAEAILANCRDQAMRTERIAMLDKRHPADSRLAINWAERFEDYYRIWSCAYAIGADLTAYRSTLLEVGRPWDDPNEPGKLLAPMSTETESYSQEYQAEGYIRFALYRFATFLAEMHRFQVKRGGFWMLSDADTETKASDAIYRIGWFTPNNERDDSWLRVSMQQSQGELHTFQHILMTTGIGQATHGDWQEWAAKCQCVWTTDGDTKEPEERSEPNEDGNTNTGNAHDAHFATSKAHHGISSDCHLHQLVLACQDYIELIDDDWLKIADWYRIDEVPRRGLSGEGLYGRWG